MHYPRFLVPAALALMAAVPATWAADAAPVVQNAKVRVTDNTLQPGETQTLSDHRPSLIVCFDGDRATIGGKSDLLHRGQTVFLSASTSDIRNTGSKPLHFARVSFLENGSSVVWHMKGLPPNYKMVVENRYARVYDIKIPAQLKEPLHTHHGRVVICLSGAKLEHEMPNGQMQPSTLTTGEIVWRPGQTHVGHNIGNTALWAIAVEPK